jgi:hypothetical protein
MKNLSISNFLNIDLWNDADTFLDFSLLTKKSLAKANKHKRTYSQILIAIAWNKKTNSVVYGFYPYHREENKTILIQFLTKCLKAFPNMKIIRADRLFSEWQDLEKEFNIKVCVIPKVLNPYNSHAERQFALFKSQFYQIVDKLPKNPNIEHLCIFLNLYMDEVLNHKFQKDLMDAFRKLNEFSIVQHIVSLDKSIM